MTPEILFFANFLHGFGMGCLFFYFVGLPRHKAFWREEWEKEQAEKP